MPFIAGVVESMGIDGIHFMEGRQDNTASSSSVTFTDVNIGPAHSGRDVIVAIVVSYDSGSTSTNTLTIGGTSVTDKAISNGGSTQCTIGRITKTTGETINIVFTAGNNATMSRCSLFVYRVVRKTSGGYSDSQSRTSISGTSAVIDSVSIPAGGVIIGVGRTTSLSNVTVSGTNAVKALELDSVSDSETDYSWFIDGTNYIASSTPTVTSSWGSSMFYDALAAAW